jgi:uncharacterized repeat protein (TIGR03803 family)
MKAKTLIARGGRLRKKIGRKPRWCDYAFPLALVLALAAVAIPSAQGQTFTSLYSFQGPPDGISPDSPLLGLSGNLYGTTQSGGKYLDWQYGTLFELSSTGQETVLYDFTGGAFGAYPYGGLTDVGGILYGTTLGGGSNNCFAENCGTVFADGRVVYTFPRLQDGAFPQGGLILDAKGSFYGTTGSGGDLTCQAGDRPGCGVLFRLDTNGKETVLHTFHGGTDGAVPIGGLIRDNKGSLYGATQQGGWRGDSYGYAPPSFYGCGVLFKLDATGRETVLHRFKGGAMDGAYPSPGSLVMDARGNLYGATGGGGTYNLGTVFKLDKTGKMTVLHSFGAPGDGVGPYGGLVRDAAGCLYGVTWSGGTSNLGTVFKMTKSGKETVLHSFAGRDGANPGAGLFRDAEGNIYGTTSAGGTSYNGYGTIFKIAP